MKKIQLILLLTLSLFLLDCNPVEYTEYYPTEIITYSFQNSSSTDVIFRIYSSVTFSHSSNKYYNKCPIIRRDKKIYIKYPKLRIMFR